MNEKEIRLQQTKKVFDTIAKLISENESCSYRYLIYDLLGFKEDTYCELISGLTITNMLVDYQQLQKQKDDVVELIIKLYQKEYNKTSDWWLQEELCNNFDDMNIFTDFELLRMLGEIDE